MMQPGHLVRARALLALCAAIALSACEYRDLTASWYVVPPPPENEAGASPGLYVALLNRGPKEAELHGVSLDRTAGDGGFLSRPNARPRPVWLRPGDLLILNTGKQQQNCAPLIQIPLGVYVRVGKRQKLRFVKVERPMPSSLPQEWLPPCPDGGAAPAG